MFNENGVKVRFGKLSMVIAGLLFIGGPLLFVTYLRDYLHREVSPDVAFRLSCISFVIGFFILFAVLIHLPLKKQGIAWRPDKPRSGIAGKSWGLLPPFIPLVPLALLFLVSFLGFITLTHKLFLIPGALMFGFLTILILIYIRDVRGIVRRRREILSRSDCDDYQEIKNKALNSRQARYQLEAYDLIAQEARVPPQKIRLTDRFCHDLGTTSTFDGLLDKLGGMLLNRKRMFKKTTRLDHIKTVEDYLNEWKDSSHFEPQDRDSS